MSACASQSFFFRRRIRFPLHERIVADAAVEEQELAADDLVVGRVDRRRPTQRQSVRAECTEDRHVTIRVCLEAGAFVIRREMADLPVMHGRERRITEARTAALEVGHRL